MLLLRFALILLLIMSGVCFAAYAFTRDARYLRWGWNILKVALVAALGFFGILVLERLL
jgi:hypothetical protein